MTGKNEAQPFSSVDQAARECMSLYDEARSKSADSSAFATRAAQFVTRMSKMSTTKILDAFATDLTKLEALSFHQCPLVLVYILNALLRNNALEIDARRYVFRVTCQFIAAVQGSELRRAPEATKNLANALFELGHRISPSAVLSPLVTLAITYSNEHAVNHIHHIALKACLAAFDLQAGLPLLEHPKEQLQTPITVEEVLKYHYYGGMLLTGLKQHERAMEMFYFNLSIPTRGAISAIQIESYRKLLLTSLIHTGQTSNYAGSKSDRNNPAMTASHTASEPYHQFAKGYAASLGASSDATRVDKLLATHAVHFEGSENLGLVHQAMSVLRAHTVCRLTNTYISISMRELAKAMGGDVTKDEAERIVVQMVAAGKIKARIEHAAPRADEGMAVDGQEVEDMVEFLDEDDEEAGEAGATGDALDHIKAAAAANVAEVLAQKIRQALAAGGRVKEAEKGVLLSYAKTARTQTQSREGSMFLGSTPGASSMYMTADEDMDLS